ncbi:MAG: hypothetical protein A3B13_00495 [Candidatus Liptonbacteria bacterium RIFCSPLOWO2_01_FULL_45_15]|uniref:Type 4 fimbrial biogenesis protein PilX N-terminal domain-containing protein n=1 Tax=Candidatus Liptonbacteria bacterium RIFCSPLOWO2_01_FULL_45_15 TaxID=1798649 RepID=A0A1G2CHE0_9BACT|nr:MAG: hypothetical protein A3B13_00495 [Candidatus Liptonbacteria bacterium RIFCSPLOWO2_01_FULL_45_15]
MNKFLDKLYDFFRESLFSPPEADQPWAGKKGQVLIEALIALSFLTVGFLAAFSLLGRSLSTNRASAQSYAATYLAAEGIEVARNIVDGNGIQGVAWNNGFANGDYEIEYNSLSMTQNQERFLTYDPSTNIYGYGGSVQTPFKRAIRITLVGSDEIKVNSIISWIGLGGGDSRVDLEDHFMNWRN